MLAKIVVDIFSILLVAADAAVTVAARKLKLIHMRIFLGLSWRRREPLGTMSLTYVAYVFECIITKRKSWEKESRASGYPIAEHIQHNSSCQQTISTHTNIHWHTHIDTHITYILKSTRKQKHIQPTIRTHLFRFRVFVVYSCWSGSEFVYDVLHLRHSAYVCIVYSLNFDDFFSFDVA